jgi:hypothetical protein
MTLTYLKDDNGQVVNALPKQSALAKTYDATISASTSVTLNAATTLLEITAIDKAIFYKWGATASSSDFDGIVPANTSKLVPVPAGKTTIQFIEESATAKLAVVEF